MKLLDLPTVYATQPDAVAREFSSFEEWRRFDAGFNIADRARIRAVVDRAGQHGLHGIHTGFVSQPTVVAHADGLHFDLLADGLDMRCRAVLDLIASSRLAKAAAQTRVYCGEALSPFAKALRSVYPFFVGSQFMPDAQTQADLFPIPHQDLMALSFPDSSFDLVVNIEVLEHIPDLSKAMAEVSRVLRPGGVMLATFPFLWNSPATLQKAELRDGAVHHLVDEPEYHGDSMRADRILVYQVPGWDIVEMAKRQGFSDAGFVFYSSALGGIMGYDVIGQFVFVAYK